MKAIEKSKALSVAFKEALTENEIELILSFHYDYFPAKFIPYARATIADYLLQLVITCEESR
jgi:hypothetical protein